MKTNLFLALPFLLALFAFAGAVFIEDTDGDRLNNGGIYYIKPKGFLLAIKGTSVSASKSSSCSLAVVQKDLALFDNGWAIKITTTYPLMKYITNDYPLNITFATLPSNACTKTPNWVVTKYHGMDVSPVMVGKFEEFSYPISGYYYIQPEKSEEGYYKFAFCLNKSSCGYVILKEDSQGNQRLAVSSDRSKQPLLFKFAKASGESVAAAAGISMVV